MVLVLGHRKLESKTVDLFDHLAGDGVVSGDPANIWGITTYTRQKKIEKIQL